ncbi:MAG TPA: phenylalanine--tRNA ligase subunit alpha, partial [Rugosimonospora sp.]|nr:phenylalanine--tRNA ligase subunit alpha [Rugosimonospora sp.]
MTYRNDPYDPKQVALLDPGALDEAVSAAEKAFADAATPEALGALKPAHLGDKSPVSLARREIGALPPHAKAEAGQRVNAARAAIQSRFDARAVELAAEQARRVLAEETVDVTLPWDRHPRGARHPLSTLMERIGDLFVGMGYEVAEGPEVEAEWYNFDALNI